MPAATKTFEKEAPVEKHKMKLVYAIIDRNQHPSWNKVGVGFVNGDGSINIKLQALPMNGELQIRDYVEQAAPTLRSPVSVDAA